LLLLSRLLSRECSTPSLSFLPPAFCVKLHNFAFLSPHLGDLVATYDDHFRLIGKRVGDFPLVLTKLLSLSITAEALRAVIGSKSAISLHREPVGPKFRAEGVAPINHSFSQKTKINDHSYGIKYKQYISSFLSQCTSLTDRRTDRILITRPRLITCSAVKHFGLFFSGHTVLSKHCEHTANTTRCLTKLK